jgi:7-carboxy-7-deazaguanine synthase
VYCDTAYAFHGGQQMALADVLARVAELGHPMALVTGGEPLLQREVVDLMTGLLAQGRAVVLETSGTVGAPVPLADVPAAVSRIVDIKAPASGIAADQIDWDGLAQLDASDELKLVLSDEGDYTWARTLITDGLVVDGQHRRLPPDVPLTMSPGWGALEPRDLAGWILRDRLPVRFQVQLHKVVWPEAERGV